MSEIPTAQTGALLPPFNAHSPGNTYIAISPATNSLITASDDGMIRTHTLSQEPTEGLTIETPSSILTIDVSSEYIATGNDEGEVCLHKSENGQVETTNAFKALLPIRSVKFSPDGSKLAVAADDKKFVLLSVPAGDTLITFQGHEKSVKSLAFSSDGKHLAAAVCDGNLLIYNLEKNVSSIVATMKVFSAIDPEMKELAISWSKFSDLIAVPGETTVSIIDGKRMKASAELWGHKQTTLLSSWSPNGRYLATYGEDCSLIVWDISTKKHVSRLDGIEGARDLKWHQEKNQVIFSVKSGQYYIWDLPVSDDLVSCVDSSIWASPVKPKQPSQTEQEKAPKASKLLNLDADEASDADDVSMVSDARSLDNLEDRSDDVDMYDDLDDFIVDREGEYDLEGRRNKYASSKRSSPQFPEFQKYFQPGATEFRGSKRYLSYTMTGTVEVVKQDLHQAISINFHDKSSFRPIHFKDHFGFNMATMDDRAALFAAPSAKDPEGKYINMSTLHYRPFESWANNSDWTLYMPEGEDIVGLALSLKWAAVATTAHYLRIFSSSSVTLAVLSLAAGPIVSMAGFDDFLLLVFYSSELPGARMEFQILNVKTMSFCGSSSPLPISPKSQLSWIGFSESGLPLSYDSNGVLRACQRLKQNIWVPILDTKPLRKGKQDHYWPISANDETLFYILCKAGEKEPVFPTPLISDVSFAIPVLNSETNVGPLEQQLALSKFIYDYTVEDSKLNNEYEDRYQEFVGMAGEIDKILLRLIQKACQSERPMRALDLCNMLSREVSLQIAYKFANDNHLIQLAERIGMIRQAKFSQPEVEEQEYQTEHPVKQAPKAKVFKAPMNPVAEQVHHEEQFAYPATPAVKQTSENLFSSPCFQVQDEIAKPKVNNPFKKKTALTAAEVGAQNAKMESKRTASKENDNSQNKKRKVQKKISAFMKPLSKEKVETESASPQNDDDVSAEAPLPEEQSPLNSQISLA